MTSIAASAMRRLAREEAQGKILDRFVPYNPLKRLDSDERIQRNPRESKRQNRGFRGETVTSQEKPNRRTGPSYARRAGSNTAPSQNKSGPMAIGSGEAGSDQAWACSPSLFMSEAGIVAPAGARASA
jgi:hypothetical protein